MRHCAQDDHIGVAAIIAVILAVVWLCCQSAGAGVLGDYRQGRSERKEAKAQAEWEDRAEIWLMKYWPARAAAKGITVVKEKPVETVGVLSLIAGTLLNIVGVKVKGRFGAVLDLFGKLRRKKVADA
jgi:hypothetical protein